MWWLANRRVRRAARDIALPRGPRISRTAVAQVPRELRPRKAA